MKSKKKQACNFSTCVAPPTRGEDKIQPQRNGIWLLVAREVKMARIIESENGGRRIIKMSVDDILSVVRDYQNIVPRFSSAEDTRSYLSDTVIYLPEDI